MEDKLYIKTLGEFSISYQDRIISNQANRSKKIWTLLAYIIVYHSKEISQSALIDLLWPEENTSIDSENALKTSLHRIRKILEQLQHPIKDLIIYKRNTFRFNPEVSIEIDAEQFEHCCLHAANTEIDEEQRILYYKKAFELYKGDFIPKCSEDDWAVPIVIYYHSRYINMIQEYLHLMLDRKQYEDMINICHTAAALDPYDELIQYYFILSLYHSGKQQAAIAQYNTCINIFYSNFGVEPSKQLTDLFNEIIKQENSTQVDLGLIQEHLTEKEEVRKAYLCDYSIFQHLYQIQARSVERNGLSFYLCLFTLDSVNKEDKRSLSSAMHRLEEVIGNSLRSGDIYSRYSVNQYIVLIPSDCYENSVIIGDRILRNFTNFKPKLSARVSYSLKYMNPKNFEIDRVGVLSN
jgi:DNA-binding SARP family transcriptional activator